MDVEEITLNVDRFKKAYNRYYNSLLKFIQEGWIQKLDKSISSEGLNDSVISLQACFYALPEEIQKRLLAIEFYLFIQADNEVDLYNFREHILKNQEFMYHMFTVSVRIDTEIALVVKLIENKNYDSYKYVIPRNYDFYNAYTKEPESVEKPVEQIKENNSVSPTISINNYYHEIENSNKSPVTAILELAAKLISFINH